MKARNIVFARVVAVCPTLASAEDTSGSLTTAFGAEGTTLDPTKYSAVDHYFISQMFEQLVRSIPIRKWSTGSWRRGSCRKRTARRSSTSGCGPR